ncbi:hypothetical protein E2C01_029046 [Portunus trituberculatus]|uniref:Uncharacterized protein n=1 Tax=Portunus trituberculatus TaxID=210409 RepID=A0A5B7EM32_PORTR|nr:hypothetical protein [Portunus trituberculatus]
MPIKDCTARTPLPHPSLPHPCHTSPHLSRSHNLSRLGPPCSALPLPFRCVASNLVVFHARGTWRSVQDVPHDRKKSPCRSWPREGGAVAGQ